MSEQAQVTSSKKEEKVKVEAIAKTIGSIDSAEPKEKPKRKNRFACLTEDSQISSGSTVKSDSTPPPPPPPSKRPREDIEKNMNTGKQPPSHLSKPLTANQWEKTTFLGDSDGAKRVKFLRLMGLGKSNTIESKPESLEDAKQDAAKRQRRFEDMERQYEQGRKGRARFS